MNGQLASGLDLDHGAAGFFGTPDPAGAVRVDTSDGVGPVSGAANGTPQEGAKSPVIESAEQVTISKHWHMSFAEAVTRQSGLGRGTIRVDSYGNVTRVLSSKLARREGDMADFEVVSEGLSFGTPWDRFEMVPVELAVNIMKHPRYLYALDGATDDERLLNQGVIREIQHYMANPSSEFRRSTVKRLYYSIGYPGTVTSGVANPANSFSVTPAGTTTPITVNPVTGTDMAKRAGLEIVMKHWRGEETPYIVGFMLVWTRYYFRPPHYNPGGYVENPLTQAVPALPDYYYSTTYPPDDDTTIFDWIAEYNPQCYSGSGLPGGTPLISWLRKADVVSENNSRLWFECVRTWVGSPVGYWDPSLYAATRRPQVPADYEVITPSLIASVF